MPPLPEGDTGDTVRAGILRGMYRFADAAEVTNHNGAARRATLLFSGPMWQVAMEAHAMLATDWGVSADAWSVTSYAELRGDALSVERANRLHPHAEHTVPYVAGRSRTVPDQSSR